MPWNTGALLLVISVLVVWIVVLTRENLIAGCSQLHLHQYDGKVTGFLPPEAPAPAAPAPAAPREAPVKVLAYTRFPKTGSRYAIDKFHRVVGKDLRVIPEAQAVQLQPLKRAFLVGSVRNPCESYLSLWAFQSDPRRRAGLMSDLKRRRPEDYARLVGKDESSDYTSPKDVQRFRTWIRFLAHDEISLGLMSGRFYGKYISTSEVNMRDNAMLVKELSSSRATEILESLKSMEVKDLADCWLHTETMDEDLDRCLKQYAARGGRVDLQLLSASGVKGASNHGNCEIFFDEETAQLVRQLDAPLFSKFGYTTCCGHAIEEPAERSGFGSPWSWGDPFDRATGRPLTTHSGSTTWRARVGPCDSSVAGPDEVALKTVQMLTLPSIRMALDESILACLKSADLSTDRKGAQLMMYQGVLSGLVLSCAFLASRLDFSPTEPFSQTDIDAINEHWEMPREGVQLDKKKKLSIFSLTGFKNRVWTHTQGRNLAQLAVFMGHADLIRAILGAEALSKPMDEQKRSLQDYLIAPGCPVYNWPMADLVASAVFATSGPRRYRVERPKPTGMLSCDGLEYPELSLGWTQETTWEHYGACDFEVLDALSQKDFEENYRDLGRPVLLRNFASIEDRCNVRKGYVMQAHSKDLFELGPIAYPNLIGAEPCEKRFTVEEAEQGAHCERHGNTSNYYASHSPGLVPTELTKMKTFEKVKEILPRINHMSKQYFWGGDRSGAALHYHVAAFNVLFIGEKEWYVTPPYLAARSGIATDHLFHRSGINEKHLFRCTQYAGDLVLVPDGWGHATLNHGFGLGIGVLYDETHSG